MESFQPAALSAVALDGSTGNPLPLSPDPLSGALPCVSQAAESCGHKQNAPLLMPFLYLLAWQSVRSRRQRFGGCSTHFLAGMGYCGIGRTACGQSSDWPPALEVVFYASLQVSQRTKSLRQARFCSWNRQCLPSPMGEHAGSHTRNAFQVLLSM